ncbi:hypothetical protein FB107DRAFT_221536 [Schizophyllum commune]
MSFSCPYCERPGFETAQGVNIHISQRRFCREREAALLAMESDNESSGSTMSVDSEGTEGMLTSDTDKENHGNEDITMHKTVFVEEYPDKKAGAPCRREQEQTVFEKIRQRQEELGLPAWGNFASMGEWEQAEWLMTSGLSHTKIDRYLKLSSVRDMHMSFKNKRKFLMYIDALPCGPEWTCDEKVVRGNKMGADGVFLEEVLELWRRDPVDCIRELIGNPAFKGKTVYSPQRIFRSKDTAGNGLNREYSEMWTADWWWDLQKQLPIGSTVTPVILSSDKTQLSTFSGDKQAWPVYLTIGNIAKNVRRKSSSYATILVGYIPVTKLECFTAEKHSDEGYRLFHECMRDLLHPLVKAAQDGVEMTCSDGWRSSASSRTCPSYRPLNLRPINPFWSEMQFCDIFSCITPDILHQLHIGLFKDHYRKWATQCFPGNAGERKQEMDARFRTMPIHHDVRHFAKGISTTTQWTGHEYKQMEKQFLGAIDGAVDPAVVRTGRGLLDFIHYAHFEVHTDVSLKQMDNAWSAFHSNKVIFEDLGVRTHFNISKLHNIKHYVDSIRSRGTADGFNTESTERLHIDFAKLGYRASSRKAYTAQMTRWLRRQEAIARFRAFLRWAVPKVDEGSEAVGDEDEEDEEAEAEGGGGAETPAAKSEEEGEEERYSEANYIVAKKPAFPRALLADLVINHQVPDFIHNFHWFLRAQGIKDGREIAETATLAVYRQIKVRLPDIAAVASDKRHDTIHAVPPATRTSTSSGLQREVPGNFSTVLVRERSAAAGASPLDGLRAARVRLIFKAPPLLIDYPHPLAYIEWYTPFSRRSQDLGMFSIGPSTAGGRRSSTIIPITQLVRSCHLTPVFGSAVPPSWTAYNVLDMAPRFHLNPYLRHHDFYLLRYLFDLYTQRQASSESSASSSGQTRRGAGRGSRARGRGGR